MKIRDSHAKLNGDNTTFNCPSDGLEILSLDDRSLFRITLDADGVLSVWSGDYCTWKGTVLTDEFVLIPHARNIVKFQKLPRKK